MFHTMNGEDGIGSAGGGPRKPRTRSLLVAQMVKVTASLGYAETSVERVLAGTGISRSTFYQHFGDKLGCFLVALRFCAEGFVAELAGAAGGRDRRPERLVVQIVAAAAADPERARVIFIESLAAGARATELRNALLARCEELLEEAATASGVRFAVAPRSLLGGTFRLLAIRLGRGEPLDEELGGGLETWWRAYLSEAPNPLFRDGEHEIEPIPIASLPSLDRDSAAGQIFGAALEPSQRQRIQAAVIALCHEVGYEAMTVAAITARAEISRKAFYAHYAGKADAVLAANESIFQAAMTACAAGFFSAAGWPERAWEGGVALLSFIDANPAAARIGFLEGPAISHQVAELVYERASAFTLFLQDGYRASPRAEALSPLLPEALMAAMFEWAAAKLRGAREGSTLLAELPALSAVILIPFIGQEQTAASIEAMLAREAGC
jgi:AcrR family transcriptional regulator